MLTSNTLKKSVVIMELFILFLCISLSLGFPNSGRKHHIDGRIIGGEVARSGQFPFAAAIYTITADGTYFCGGTLLHTQWILTAGQCVDGVETFSITLGTNKLKGDDSFAVKVSSDTYVLHPNYNSSNLDNDVGLIFLREPVEYTDYLKPIDFLPFGVLSDHSSATAIGWGQISDDESGLADELRWVYVTSLPDQECRITYGNQITDSMVCVDGNYNEGTCVGDSGGPLVQIISRGHSVIVGISSFFSGNGCESTDPSGYTKLFPYNDWIKNVTGRS